ncbi:MAG: hypothetical protein LUF92_03750 [Clostridiales bacterium]|nr:hypothetical protein [Clostridiales bacterium]
MKTLDAIRKNKEVKLEDALELINNYSRTTLTIMAKDGIEQQSIDINHVEVGEDRYKFTLNDGKSNNSCVIPKDDFDGHGVEYKGFLDFIEIYCHTKDGRHFVFMIMEISRQEEAKLERAKKVFYKN